MNGPHVLAINFEQYVEDYINSKHERCDAIHRHGGPRKHVSLDPHEDEEHTSRATTYSALYVV